VSPSAFLERGAPPGEKDLDLALGGSRGLWDRLLAALASEAPVVGKWSFSGKSHGWLLRVMRGRRTVVYLIPSPGRFVASFALSGKACEAARASDLPRAVMTMIEDAPIDAEGRNVRIEVRAASDLAVVLKVASLAFPRPAPLP
jgi:uncharacterized protein DUF3788